MKCQNCLPCAVSTAVLVTSFLGFPFIKYCCKHTNTDQLKIIIRPSKVKFCTSLAVLLFLIIVCGVCAMNLRNSFQNENPYLYVMIHAFDVMTLVCSITAIAVSMLHVNIIIDMINTYQRAVDKWQELTSQILLSKIDTLRIRKRVYTNLVLIGVLMIGYAMVIFSATMDTNWSLFEKVGMMTSFYINLLLVFIVDSIAEVYFCTYRSYQNHIENELLEIFFINKNLKNILIDFAQLHIQLKKVPTLFNDFVNPTAMIWIIACLIKLIVSTAVSMLCFIESKTNPITARIILMQTEFGIYLFSVAYLGRLGDKITGVGSNGLKFFNKFPMSKLDCDEAAKYEVLESFFIKVNPSWEASNIFTIGIRLVGSMCGTVITYVVVVLQFYIEWIKNKN